MLALSVFGLIGSPLRAQGWNAISGTALSNVQPANCTGTAPPSYCSGVTYDYPVYDVNVLNAWGGATADPVGNMFYVWSGGHTDYAGNEVYQINVASSTVTRLTDPSTPNAVGSEANPDGTPNARHTYDNLVWLSHSQQMFAFGGEGLYPMNGGPAGSTYGSASTWLFNPNTRTWTQKSSAPIGTSGCCIANCFPNTLIATKDVVECFVQGVDDWYQYDVNTDTWSRLTNVGTAGPLASTVAWDGADGVSVIVNGAYQYGTSPGIYLSTWSGETPTYPALQTTTGCSASWTGQAPAIDYDTSINSFVIYPGNGNTVYAYDYRTNVCVPYTFLGGPTSSPANGMYGRMAYFPSLNEHVVINSFTTNPIALTMPALGASTTALTVSMTAPAQGAAVTGTVAVSASAADDVAVASVQFQLDGANIGAPVTSAPYSVSWNTTNAINGSHILGAVAIDASGSSAAATAIQVTVDNVVLPPSVSITAPANGATVAGAITVAATAASTLGVASVQFNLDGGSLGAPRLSAPYAVSLNTTTVNNGSHTLTAVAVDVAGTSTTSASVTVTVSNTATSPSALPITGLGASTLTCVNVDGDGYGVGPGCLGPDADDFDPTVNTAAQAIAKWGSIAGLIAHRQTTYANLGLQSFPPPTAIWYVSPTGNDSTCAANNASLPCATFAHTFSVMATGSLILPRGGVYSEMITMPSGTSTSVMNGIMSYPGELAVFDGSILSHNADIQALDTDYWYIDGLKVTNGVGDCINGGSTGTSGSSTFHDIILRHVEGSGNCGLGTAQFINGLVNVTFEYGAYHDNDCPGGNCQHGLYLGSDEIPSSNVTVRRNLFFNNDWNGLHFNGRVTNLIVDQNVSYSNGIAGLDFQEGVSNSFIRSNLVFDNANGITLVDYPGNCPSQGLTPGLHAICPYDQINNVFENNTIYSTGNITTAVANPGTSPQGCPEGVLYCENAVITVNNNTSPLVGNLGSNTYRNNILVNYGYSELYPSIVFADPLNAVTCDSTCLGWATSSTFANNQFWQSDGVAGSAAFSLGGGYTNPVLSIAGAISAGLTVTNSSWGNPAFVAASPTYSNSPTSFNFQLTPSSPAVAAGSSVGMPAYDLIGYALANPPAIGAYQFQSAPSSVSLCDLNGDGVVNGADVDSAINQVLDISPCTNADLQGNGLCTVVDVQRVTDASLGGACRTGP